MIRFEYLYKGICGLARAHKANGLAGHLGAAVVAGYFFGEEHPVQSLLKDVIIMADSLKAKYPDVPHFIMGHSMGSFIVRTVMKHHAHSFAGAILMGSADTDPLAKVILPINKALAKIAPKKPNAVFANIMNKIFNSKLNNRMSS